MFVHGFHKQTPANVIAIENATPSPFLAWKFYVICLFLKGGVRLALINSC